MPTNKLLAPFIHVHDKSSRGLKLIHEDHKFGHKYSPECKKCGVRHSKSHGWGTTPKPPHAAWAVCKVSIIY